MIFHNNAVYHIYLMPKILLLRIIIGTKMIGNELKELFQH